MDKKGLGRGLSALIPGGGTPASGVTEIEVDSVALNPFQPRKNVDEAAIAELANSIQQHGVIQPIVVRRRSSGGFELVAGERRLRAARSIHLQKIPAVLRDMKDQESLEIALIENIQREDISPLDAARAYRRLMDEFDLSQEEVSQRVGKSRSGIANTLRLLQLPTAVQARLEAGEISEGHARALLAAPNASAQQLIADEIVRRQCSVRETERMAKNWAATSLGKPGNVSRETYLSDTTTKTHLAAVEERLREILHTRVRVMDLGDRGKIEIEFYGEDDLTRLLTLIADVYAMPRQ